MRVGPQLVSTLLVPATAFTVAVTPAVLAPAAAGPRAVPVVQVEEIQLAGIGQDIYNAITPVVQTVVGDVSYLINFIPLAGGIAAAQININYFQGIQPAVAATVDYAAAVVHDPLALFPITKAYVDALVGIGYGLVSAQLRFLGFNELPPRIASTAPANAAGAAARPGKARRSAAAVTPHPAAAKAPKASKATKAAKRHSAQRSSEARRQKSTTGRTRSAI